MTSLGDCMDTRGDCDGSGTGELPAALLSAA